MMSFVSTLRRVPSFSRCCSFLFIGFLLSGCGKEDIHVYIAPKDKPAASLVGNGGLAQPRPQLSWKLPPGWQETGPGQMSLASFAIKSSEGREASVNITPLALLAGRDTEIVNMWRSQVGLDPLNSDEATKQFQVVDVGGEPGKLFEVTGKSKDNSEPVRIVTAMVHRSGKSWFYKLTGDAAFVDAQKPAFLEFLKSIHIEEAAATANVAASDPAPKMNWQVPSQWKELPPGQMQVAKFAVPERDHAKAEVFVSVFPSDTGGALANVNRWRKQIGLGEVSKEELASMVSPLDPATPAAVLVEMTNQNKRLVGAIVPRAGSYWFYKMLGDESAVAPQKESFVAFAKSTP